MRSLIVAAAAVATFGVSSTAGAQDAAIRVAHDAITGGNLGKAERVLLAEQRIFPNSPEVLVNLAAVYATTGRASEANTLYRRVLAQGDVQLDLSSDRQVSSHQIAQTGLQRLARVQTAAR